MKKSFGSVLVVEGGAMRGVFSTGLLDGFLEAGFNPFDFYLGVSSGASNLAAFLADMKGRNARIYMDYSLRPEFISITRFLCGGHLLDLDWLWAITIRENRLDLDRIFSKCKPLIAVLTDVRTGQAYYRQTAPHDLEAILKASSAMPLFYRNYPLIGGHLMTDGGIADPLPVSSAIRLGGDRIMVVRSRPRSYLKRRGFSDKFMGWYVRRYPLLREKIAKRVETYNSALRLIRNPPQGVSIVEICPPENFRVGRTCRSRALLRAGYDQGRASARGAIELWQTPKPAESRLPG